MKQELTSAQDISNKKMDGMFGEDLVGGFFVVFCCCFFAVVVVVCCFCLFVFSFSLSALYGAGACRGLCMGRGQRFGKIRFDAGPQ